jgi:GDPmannose 4,6-dehydratase
VALLQQDEPDDYVIGTGHTCSVRDRDAAFGAVGPTTKNIVLDPRFIRPAEVNLLVADGSKAAKKLVVAHRDSSRELVCMTVEADLKRHEARS